MFNTALTPVTVYVYVYTVYLPILLISYFGGRRGRPPAHDTPGVTWPCYYVILCPWVTWPHLSSSLDSRDNLFMMGVPRCHRFGGILRSHPIGCWGDFPPKLPSLDITSCRWRTYYGLSCRGWWAGELNAWVPASQNYHTCCLPD